MEITLTIPTQIKQQMVNHLREVFPEEGCGLLRGVESRVTGIYPIENIHRSRTLYELDPQQQIDAFMDAEAREEEILAVYHSHPSSAAVPSETDVDQAYYPNLVYLIVSFFELDKPIINGFLIEEGDVLPIALEFV